MPAPQVGGDVGGVGEVGGGLAGERGHHHEPGQTEVPESGDVVGQSGQVLAGDPAAGGVAVEAQLEQDGQGRDAVALVGGAGAAVTLRATGLNDRIDGALVRGLQRVGVPAPRVALAAAASLAMLLANEDARRTRRDAVELAVTGPAGLDEDTVDEVEPEATAELPVEVRVLLETLLDPALAEGRDLPGAEALRSQLPRARTVTSVAEAIREAGEVPDWVPLVVETDDDVRRAVPNDCVWPVRGRFASGSAGGHELELRLQVIDGEIGALTVTLPADAEADSDAWDAFQEIESFPGVEDLTFHVDGDRRA